MKSLLTFFGLISCMLLISRSGQSGAMNQNQTSITQQLTRQIKKTEEEIICRSKARTLEVYHVLHSWIVNEYADGRIDTRQTHDTTHLQSLPAGSTCPQLPAAETLR